MKLKAILAIGLSSLMFAFSTSCQREIVSQSEETATLSPKAERTLADQFSSYDRISYDSKSLYAQVSDLAEGASADIILLRSTTSEPWLLHLTRNGVVQDDFYGIISDGKTQSRTEPLGIRTFEGTVEGGGIVSLTVSPTLIAGSIEHGGAEWIIDPIQKYDPTAKGMAIAYREQDVLAKPLAGNCVELQVPGASTHRVAPQNGEPAPLAANCWQIATMVHGDRQYLLQVGGNTNTAIFLMVAAINTSSSRFTSINIHLFVPSGSAIQNTNADNLSYDSQVLLNQVRNIDNLLYPNVARDITLFYTGRNMTYQGSYGVAGMAWVGTLCAYPSYAYGVAETINGAYNGRIQTHEIGHMIGALHDGGCPGGLMYPYYNHGCASDYPSAYSKSQINAHIWYNHGCIQMAPGC